MFKSVRELFGGGATQRIAVIDVGSNSVRMVVFLAETRIPAVLFNEKSMCALGADLDKTGRLSEEGKARALGSLQRFKALAMRLKVDVTLAIGTAALRDAEDGPEFVVEASKLGVDIEIIPGREEARLAAQGVLLGDPWAKGIVADLGGASMELMRIDAEAAQPLGAGVTTPLGALRLISQLTEEGSRSAVVDRIDAVLDEAVPATGIGDARPPTIYALGGSFRTYASAWMELRGYPLRVLHGFSLPYDEAIEAAEWLSRCKPAELRQISGVSERRARVTPAASLALSRLIKRVKPKRVAISAFGLREGAYWERLAPELRAADPLLDSARRIENDMARDPGLGDELFNWLCPALTTFSERELRLSHAACLLADASWRTHPDYRAMASFELMTRNSFGGIDHKGRAFVGEALLHRHKGGARAARMEPCLALATAERRARAEALGRGMRFGAALSGASRGLLGQTPLRREGEVLELRRPSAGALLLGDTAQKRFESFARACGCEARIQSDVA